MSFAPQPVGRRERNKQQKLDRITAAGAIFVGAYAAETLGDYAAGPSHVLPTFGSARYAAEPALPLSGAMAMLNPRATEEATYQRWTVVFRANAMTSACYVLSVNRPYPEQGVQLGGPSVAIDPRGDVILETTDRMALVTLDASAVLEARRNYPGYLPVRARLYADAWDEIARGDG